MVVEVGLGPEMRMEPCLLHAQCNWGYVDRLDVTCDMAVCVVNYFQVRDGRWRCKNKFPF
jgi:hypothetical protein